MWVLAPAWYFEKRSDRVCLEDILFAQWCLFLAIRIHDDLIDSQVRGPWLIAVGDDLLVEAQIQFARHVDDSAFWSLFRRAFRNTLHGIADVDRLQMQRAGMPASALGLYAQVSGILSLGVAAVLARANRLAEYRMFQRFFGDLAIAGQLLDDLEDIEEDAVRGRLNVAATTIIGSRRTASRCRQAAVRRKVFSRRIVFDGAARAVIDLARTHAQRASRTARAMGLAKGVKHAAQVVHHCELLDEAAHRATVDVMFARLKGL